MTDDDWKAQLGDALYEKLKIMVVKGTYVDMADAVRDHLRKQLSDSGGASPTPKDKPKGGGGGNMGIQMRHDPDGID